MTSNESLIEALKKASWKTGAFTGDPVVVNLNDIIAIIGRHGSMGDANKAKQKCAPDQDSACPSGSIPESPTNSDTLIDLINKAQHAYNVEFCKTGGYPVQYYQAMEATLNAALPYLKREANEISVMDMADRLTQAEKDLPLPVCRAVQNRINGFSGDASVETVAAITYQEVKKYLSNLKRESVNSKKSVDTCED